MLFSHYADPDRLRALAGEIKQHVVENLDTYLPSLEQRLLGNGVRVHWASTAEAACSHVHAILEARGARRLVKAKTMVSEEIGLDEYLRARGIEALESIQRRFSLWRGGLLRKADGPRINADERG